MTLPALLSDCLAKCNIISADALIIARASVT